MMMNRLALLLTVLFFARSVQSQQPTYPQNYFRHPLNIPMQLVGNFGEIRTSHWHMGLDIRTQQRENLQVYAAAEGYVSRVMVEPGGFGQAIYIDHPNGFTTLYAHMNGFFPALEKYVREKQYEQESWHINLQLPPGLFPVKKGTYIGRSGNTGGSQGPHVHFEIRDTKTENVLNPLLFKFPVPDNVAPDITRLAMYDRSKSTYEQKPQLLTLKRSGNTYTITQNAVRVGSNRISFAIGAVDRFSGLRNPNGIYSTRVLVDGEPVSSIIHDNISYPDSRYINAQLDYPFKIRGGGNLQHLSPLPGSRNIPYEVYGGDGVIELNDGKPHRVVIEVRDANMNLAKIQFDVQYDEKLAKAPNHTSTEKLIPNQVNVFEREDFELFTSEFTIYDTVEIDFKNNNNGTAGSVSPVFSFMSHAIPSHDHVTVRILPGKAIPEELKNRIVIRNVSGSRIYLQKAVWQQNWLSARFRQFGTYQAFIDDEPPTINNVPADLSKSRRIVFTPKDNFNVIKSFRAELNGKWLRFTNDKGRNWIYVFDEHFPKGSHELKVMVEDEAGNVMEKTWKVRR